VIDTAIHGYYKPSGKYYYSTVRAEVMDTIKGRHYLNCIDHPSDKMLPKIASIPATKNCIEFEYSPSLVRLPPAITTLGHLSVREEPLMDTDGTPWVKPGKEYIVFLKLDYLYDESFVVEPDLYSTHMCGMFPINNGIVDNRYGDFGLQANLTTREFIDALKEEIVDIVSP